MIVKDHVTTIHRRSVWLQCAKVQRIVSIITVCWTRIIKVHINVAKEIAPRSGSKMVRITIDTSDVRFCKGCNARAPTVRIYRHHKGHDGLLGRYHPGIAEKYYKWLHCVDLCNTCHMGIHWWLDLKCLSRKIVTRRNAKRLRKKLIALSNEWLKMEPAKRPQPSRDFVVRWEINHEDWLRRHNLEPKSSDHTSAKSGTG